MWELLIYVEVIYYAGSLLNVLLYTNVFFVEVASSVIDPNATSRRWVGRPYLIKMTSQLSTMGRSRYVREEPNFSWRKVRHFLFNADARNGAAGFRSIRQAGRQQQLTISVRQRPSVFASETTSVWVISSML